MGTPSGQVDADFAVGENLSVFDLRGDEFVGIGMTSVNIVSSGMFLFGLLIVTGNDTA